MKRLIYNIGMLATPTGSAARASSAQGEISLLRDAWILIGDGVILSVGTGKAPDAD